MKNTILYLFTFTLFSVIFTSCDLSSIDFKKRELPSKSKIFINHNFPNNKIDSISMNIDRFYTAYLDNGAEIYFNNRGEWIDVWFNKQEPDTNFLSTLPQNMLNYISDNYPNSQIREIEKNNYFSRNFTYSVNISKSKIDLTFNKNGERLESKLQLNDLPKQSESFINKYFPEDSVIYIEQGNNRSYLVYFESGAWIYFERKGSWLEISSKKHGLPNTIIDMFPKQAKDYLTNECENQKILKIEKKSYGYRVHLSKPNERYISFSRVGAICEGDIFDN